MEKIHRRVRERDLVRPRLNSSSPRMKYPLALEYVLQNAPVRAKDPEKKVRTGETLRANTHVRLF